MNQLLKWLSLLLAGVMLTSVLLACTEDEEDAKFAKYADLCPSELYEALLEADEYKISVNISYAVSEDDSYEVKRKLYKNDELVKISVQNNGDEMERYYDFDEELVYIQNQDGVFSAMPIEELGDNQTLKYLVDSLLDEDLFDDDHYKKFDEETGRYVMKKSVAEDHGNEKLYIEVDGTSYRIHADGESDDEADCKIKFESTKVKLPQIGENRPSPESVPAVTTRPTSTTEPADTTQMPAQTTRAPITTPPPPVITEPCLPDDWTLMPLLTDWHYRTFYCPTLYNNSNEGVLYDPYEDEMAAWLEEKGDGWYKNPDVLEEMSNWPTRTAPMGDRYDALGENGSPIGWSGDDHGLICYTTFELTGEEMSWVEMADVNDIYMDVWYDNTFYIWINGTLVYFHDGEGAPQDEGGNDWNDYLEPIDFMDGVDIREVLKEGTNEIVVSLKDSWGGREFILGLKCVY